MREENIEIFLDTQYRIKNNEKLSRAVIESSRNERLILERDNYIPKYDISYGGKARIIVSSKRTFEAASGYKGMKTAVLNFASAVSPGGGVVKGSSAQEESLCRISTLYPCLKTRYIWNNFYLPHRNGGDRRNNDDTIYTPGVIVFKTDDSYPREMREEQWYSVNVLTTAAPDLRRPKYAGDRAGVTLSDGELFSLHAKRIRRILTIASGEGNEAVILGAYGCGAFRNPPFLVAEAFKKVIEEGFLDKFKVIEFAIYSNPDGRPSDNLMAFREVFR